MEGTFGHNFFAVIASQREKQVVCQPVKKNPTKTSFASYSSVPVLVLFFPVIVCIVSCQNIGKEFKVKNSGQV